MTTMKRIGALAGSGALVLSAACAELNVTNPNNPDIDRATASAADLQSISSSVMNSWYFFAEWIDPYFAMMVTADVLTSNFGNFGMRFNNVEPRIPYENNSAGGDRFVAQTPWTGNYSVLGAANDAVRGFDVGGVTIPGGLTQKYRSLAQFGQAASLMNLALTFDQGFIVDENTDLSGASPLPTLQPYTDVAAVAKAKWDALIEDIGPEVTFCAGDPNHARCVYSADILPMVGGLTPAKLRRIANTMAAMLERYLPRTHTVEPDWNAILAYTNNGIGTGAAGAPFDMLITGDGWANNWYSGIGWFSNEASWVRVDMRTINQMDPSQPAPITAEYIPSMGGTWPPPMSSADARANCGAPSGELNIAQCGDFEYHGGPVLGDFNRGPYMISPYAHRRYRPYARLQPTNAATSIPYILAAESDLLRAEALIRSTTPDLGAAAALINQTRVVRGNLPAATAGHGADQLLEYIYYERLIELMSTNGMDLFRQRQVPGWLQVGTWRHLPVSAQELEIQGLPVYTCGGASEDPGGMCGVGASVARSSRPNPLRGSPTLTRF